MKKSFKFSVLAAMVLMAGFSSCSNDDDAPAVNTEKKVITLKIDTQKPSTYADEGSATGTTAPVSDAIVYFVDAAGNVETALDAVAVPAGSQIDITDIYGVSALGHTETVSTGVTKVMIVGNVPTAAIRASLLGAANEAAIKAEVLAIADQATVTDVTLAGSSTSMTAAGAIGGVPQFNCAVVIEPLVSRFEISQIEFDAAAAGNSVGVTDFDVTGIFVNKAYRSMTIDKTVSGMYNAGTTVANYVAANFGSLADVVTAPATYLGSSASSVMAKLPTAAPGVWAYQFFPVNSVSGDQLPELVIQLDNFVGTTGTITGTQFVSVAQFIDASGAPVTKFDSNFIYTISNIKFDESHLSATPSITTKGITVTVSVKPWDQMAIEPNI